MNNQVLLKLLVIFTATLITGITWANPGRWEKVSEHFFENDKPYGAGDFKIRGNQVIALKLADAETVFKPGSAEYTESWMNDVNERANRDTVRVLTGTLNGTVRRVFEKTAQFGAWWLSPDWNVIYVSTGWIDFHTSDAYGKYTRQLTQLFKSTDQGQTWRQLNWPQDADINSIRFLDSQRGYITGQGPHIWRTADGGASWTEIAVPPQAKDPLNSRKRFDFVSAGKDGVLRFSFIVGNAKAPESQVYTLNWNDDTPVHAFSLKGQMVADIVDYQGQLYILTWRGTSLTEVHSFPAISFVYRFTGKKAKLLHQFDAGFSADALYITPAGGLLTTGVNEAKPLWRAPGMFALSYDQGKSWKIEQEDAAIYATYDEETGTFWRVDDYSLYKRSVP